MFINYCFIVGADSISAQINSFHIVGRYGMVPYRLAGMFLKHFITYAIYQLSFCKRILSLSKSLFSFSLYSLRRSGTDISFLVSLSRSMMISPLSSLAVHIFNALVSCFCADTLIVNCKSCKAAAVNSCCG